MEPQKRKQYAPAQLEAALLAINEGTSIYEASKTYGIPRTTLRDKKNNREKRNKRVSKKNTPTVAISDEFMEYQKKNRREKTQEEEKKNKIKRAKKQVDFRKAKENKNMGAVSKQTSVEKHNTLKALETRRNVTSSSESESDLVLIPRQNNYKVKDKNPIHSGYTSTSARVLLNASSSDTEELHAPKTDSDKRHIIFPSDSDSDNIFNKTV